jgi:ribonuclease BN (tRNA processing enzyme)
VFGKLRAACDYVTVDAVVLSHLHADHVLDLVPFASALAFGPRAGAVPRPALHAPAGARASLAALCEAVGMSATHIESRFELREYDPAERLEAGDLRLRFQPVPHYVPANAVEVAGDGRRFTFGADGGPSDELVAFASGTDLLLVEATLPEADEPPRGHMTPAEAGEHGRRAGAARLVITHISDEMDLAAARAAASRGYGGEAELAVEGAVYEL